MTIYVAGVAGVVAFYIAVVGLGIWAAATKRKKNMHSQDSLILANRDLGLFLGVITLVATWVGGAFINGTAEAMYTKGLVWCQVPIGYSLSLLFGALLFVKPMRKAEHVTILDPFQQHYGAKVGGLLFLPALCGDLFWCGAVLKALGSSLSVVADINPNISVCASALLASTYTVFGGLYSVACTDALQLICITLGLAISAPFAALHPAVSLERSLATKEWLGEIKNEDFGEWIDKMLLLIFGGIPWQAYFQRILSIRSTSVAQTLSVVSMFGCLGLAVPSAMIGIIARSTDWSLVESFNKTAGMDNGNAVLPLVLRHLTPQWVSFLGLGAISAAVMSSADSSILASSSMFARNIYRLTFRPKASEKELDWILRISVLIVSILSASVALTIKSVYYMSYMCSDLVYVVLFPQLLSVIHWPSLVDTYGSLAGYIVAISLRIAGGEKALGIPSYIEYPYYDRETHTQKFPFRTAAMMSALTTQLVVSFFTRNLLGQGYFPRCCDVLNVYSHKNVKSQSAGVVQSSSGAALVESSNSSIARTPSFDALSEATNLNVISRRESMNERCEVMKSRSAENIIQHANQNLQNLKLLQEQSAGKICASTRQIYNSHLLNGHGGQILGVRHLPTSRALSPPTVQCIGGTLRPSNPAHICSANSSFTKVNAGEKTREPGDRSNMELNLSLSEGQTMMKSKNIKGVKLIGMDGGTLRRPSLQGTFSPTPSVELVHILDRRQSSGSYGPTSLSPVPGVEACKTHGTAISGQGSEHCRIKRSIVRHHSFNDTGDRALTTLARQPNYPSMPLRPEDCRMTLAKRDKKSNVIPRYPPPSSFEDKGFTCGNTARILVSPTYSMYGSAVKSCNYFVADDEAVSRF